MPDPWTMVRLLDEQLVDDALLRIRAPGGSTVGTGFFILPSGLALTCHHVVAGFGELKIEPHRGKPFTIRAADIDPFPELDLAFLHCPAVGRCLPVDAGHRTGLPYWTKGFQQVNDNIRSAFPAEGIISGTTHVTYRTTTSYSIDGALVLKDDIFDAGLSGAPVLDPESGVVIGVVNALFERPERIGGFALPISMAMNGPASLVESLKQNRVLVPRYGRFLNAIAARQICQRQRELVVKRLYRSEVVLPHQYVERRRLRQTLAEFLEGTARILPLVGPSGVGKTTELTQYAHSTDQRTALLFITAAGIGDAYLGGLSATIDDELRQIANRELAGSSGLQSLVAALNEEGQRLLVLLDGLNEARRVLRDHADAWIQRTTEWLEASQARLTITCRPEYWDDVKEMFPVALLYKAGDSAMAGATQTTPVHVGDFSDEEAQEAMHAYDLPANRLVVGDVLHPLMARIYWETKDEGDVVRLSRYGALESLVERKCRKVSLALGGQTSTSEVRRLLSLVAKATLLRQDLWVNVRTFVRIFEGNAVVRTELVRENVFTEARGGFRFTFDEVAELLQAQQLDLARATGRAPLVKIPGALYGFEFAYRGATIIFAHLRLEREQGPEAFAQAVDQLVTALENTGDVSLRWLLGEIFLQADKPSAVLLPIKRYAAPVILPAPLPGEVGGKDVLFGMGRRYATAMVRGVALSLPDKFAVLRILIRNVSGYDWEPSHWDRFDEDVLQDLDHPVSVLAEHIRKQPVASFRELVLWLEDRTRLEGPDGVAEVRHVAQALLDYYADIAFDELWDMLADSLTEGADHVMSRLTRSRAERTLAVCRRWADLGSQKHGWLAARYAGLIVESGANAAVQAEAVEVLRRLHASTEFRDVKASALLGLGTHAKIDEVTDGFRGDVPELTAGALEPFLDSEFDKVMTAFEQYVVDGVDRLRRSGIAGALQHYVGTPVQQNRIAHLLDHLLKTDVGDVGYTIARAVEDNLGAAIEGKPLSPSMASLAEKLIREGTPGMRRCIIYAATSSRSTGPGGRLQDHLLDLLIEVEQDPWNLEFIIKKLCGRLVEGQSEEDSAVVVAWILSLGSRHGLKWLEAQLIRQASNSSEFCQALAGPLRHRQVLEAQFAIREFWSQVESGVEPPLAVEAVLGTLESP